MFLKVFQVKEVTLFLWRNKYIFVSHRAFHLLKNPKNINHAIFQTFCRKRTEWKLWKTIIFWFFIWRRIPHLSEIILSPIISTDMVIQYCISLWRGETSLWNDKWFLPEVFGGNLIARPCRECYYIIWAFQIHSLDGYLLFVFHGIYVSEVKSN